MRKILGVLAAMALCSCSNDWSAGLSDKRAGSSAKSPSSMSMDQAAAATATLHARGHRSFANAPDKGSLVQYPDDQVIRRTGAYTWHAAALSEDHALRSTITGNLSFTAPDGSPINLAYERRVEHPDGNWSWIGRAEGEQGESTVITFGEEAVFGTIPQGRDQPPLRLTVSDGRTWVVSADPRLLREIRNEATHPTDQDFLVPPKLSVSTAASTATATGGMEAIGAEAALATTASGKTVVDVLVGFTDGYSAYRGGASAAITRIHNLVEVTNQAYRNSQVNAEVRLVHSMQISYPDATANKTALEELTGFKAPSTRTTPAPAFSVLRSARDQYGADVVVLLRRFQDPENDGCGIAWLIGGERSGINASDEFFGYSVVGDGQDLGTDGKTYFCRDETLAHEIGHNMGSQHDADNAKKDDGTVSYGAYNYSFGYRAAAGDGDFYTVMAYGDSGQTRNRVFSNPNVSICGRYANLVCGISGQSDNARSLNSTIPTVANFRAVVVPIPAVAHSDYDGDGKSDIYWRNTATGANDQWIMNGLSISSIGTVYRESDQDWIIAGSGDFNGDRRADVFWRNLRTGETYVHLMARSTILPDSGFSYRVADLAWKIVAFGDFDGDGKTDVYWRNTSTGVNDIWLMDGSSVRAVRSIYREADQAWKVIGAGDFNGDRFSDVIWRNSSTGQNYIHLMSGMTILPGSGYLWTVPSQAWEIAAIGDFNGDGKADIYWRSSASGQNDLWTMSGITITAINRVYTEPNPAWKIVASGDYNGDGRSDILWRNDVTGQNYMHLMNGAQIIGASSLYTVADLNWKVVGH